MDVQNKHLPNHVTWNIQHYEQRTNWDCGLSCVLMCLSDEKRQEILQNIHLLCKEEGFGQSTWTIDLCYILKNRTPEIPFYYTTVTLGVDPGYGNEAFYNNILRKDKERVNKRFQDAAANGINVEKRGVCVSELIDQLAPSLKGAEKNCATLGNTTCDKAVLH